MAVWTCPDCERTFGRSGQSHLCIPGTTVDEWFADEPPVEWLTRAWDLCG